MPTAPAPTTPPDAARSVVDRLYSDTHAAMKTYERQMGAKMIRFYPRWLLDASRADSKRLESASNAFLTEWNKALKGRRHNARALVNLMQDLGEAINALEAQNARIEAVEKANLAKLSAHFSDAIASFITTCRDQAPGLEADLEALKADLEVAEQDVTEAKLQLGINTAVNAITTFLPHLRAVRVIGGTLGSPTGGAILDAALGPKAGNTVSVPVKEAIRQSRHVSERGKAVFSKLNAVGTLLADLDEIGHAEEIAARIRERVARTRAALRVATSVWRHGRDHLGAIRRAHEDAVSTWRSETRRSRSQASRRRAAIREFRKRIR